MDAIQPLTKSQTAAPTISVMVSSALKAWWVTWPRAADDDQ